MTVVVFRDEREHRFDESEWHITEDGLLEITRDGELVAAFATWDWVYSESKRRINGTG